MRFCFMQHCGCITISKICIASLINIFKPPSLMFHCKCYFNYDTLGLHFLYFSFYYRLVIIIQTHTNDIDYIGWKYLLRD